MSSGPLISAQDFVRSLKAAADPPVPNGPSKIEIALKAWDDSCFYVPSKGEIIADWILNKLLKDKGKEGPANPIFDIRYWQLLCSVTKSEGSISDASNLNKSWLVALLHRVPLGPIVITVLNSFDNIVTKDALVSTITSCVFSLWPLSVQRMNADLLQSSFGAFIGCALRNNLNPPMAQLGQTISASYHDSLTNSTQKKKLCQSFLQAHLSDWLQCISSTHGRLPSTLQASIEDVGVQVLFNLDVLRQVQDSKSDMAFLEHLETLQASSRALVLQSSPRLLAHYIRSIKKHRGALFSQGSQLGASLDEIHQSAMNFFISLTRLIGDSDTDKDAWRARAGLLEVVKNENIFSSRQREGVTALNHLLTLSVKALHDAWQEELLDRTENVLQCMSIVAEMDHDMIQPFLHQIIPLLLQIPGSGGLRIALLDIILDYHVKTRTMDALIQAHFAAIPLPKTIPGGARQTYQACSSSPVMDTVYMQKIARALQTFLTESQCLPTLEATSTMLKEMWQNIYTILHQADPTDDNPKKKRRTSTAAVVDGRADSENLAVAYSLACRLASAVLSSLPMSSLSASTQAEAASLLQALRADFVHPAISKSLKLLKKSGEANIWTTEITLAAHLRLLYALDISRKLALPMQFDTKMLDKLSRSASSTSVPELTVETFRFLFYSISAGQAEQHETVIDHALDFLEANLDHSDNVFWLGNAFELVEGDLGKAKGAIALLHMIIERWLPLFDHFGSENQLKRLSQIFASLPLPLSSPRSQGIQARQLIVQLLRSAEFWELPNIRGVFLELLDNFTSDLDSRTGKLPKTATILEKVPIYQLLLFFPMEYLSWQSLNDLIKRALDADLALSESSSASRKDAVRQGSAVLRIFLKRAYVYSGSIAQDSHNELSKFLIHLLNKSASLDTTSNDIFTNATLDLVELYFSKLLKASKKSGPQPVLDVLAMFDATLFTNASPASSWSFITLVNLLAEEFPVDSLPEEIKYALADLYRKISSSLLPQVIKIASSGMFEQDIRANYALASGWRSILCLQKWLGSGENSDAPLVARQLTTKLITAMAVAHSPPDQLGDISATSFAILVQELDMRSQEDHASQLDLIIASYVALRRKLSSKYCDAMDVDLGKACRKISPDDYRHMLSLLPDSLAESSQLQTNQLLQFVHLSGLLLREHPSHSLQHIQKFTTAAFNVFSEQDIFFSGPIELRLEVLEIIGQHCSEQPAALRPLDLAAIWLILSKFLAPSQEHDATSTPAVFHKIVVILSAIFRLRRDLIANGLPHLGIILRRLLLCVRGCRPQLGARQTDVIMNTQPRWISSSHAMGVDEAKVLSRLLESLNTKTTVRAYSSSSTASTAPETSKAESLAKPFSKHAAYVLKAYIESMNDPLCVMPLEVRQELQPGIFALCEMVSEHSRDSLMISALDAGGKALLKTLWKEYDKQRYVGKG